MTDGAPTQFPDVTISRRAARYALVGLSAVYIAAYALFKAPPVGQSWHFLIDLGLGVILLALSYIDLRTGLLPDILTLPLLVLGLAYHGVLQTNLLLAVLGAAVGYALIAGLGLYWRRIRKVEGIGLGDAKLLAAGGAWVGISGLPFLLVIASGSALVGLLFLSRVARLAEERAAIAFGPYLALGTWVVWCTNEVLFAV